MATKIEWTDETWNPVTGCSHVSEGCRNCYAERMAKRLHAMGQAGYTGLPWTAQNAQANVHIHSDKLDQPLFWRKPRMIFVNSMSDLFHERVPFAFIKEVFNRMWRANHHTYQILTKRPERMLEFWRWFEAQGLAESFMPRIPRNIWIGVSVEDQKAADARIPKLLELPAAVRFLSCEPLLGQVHIHRLMASKPCPICGNLDGEAGRCYCGWSIPSEIHWVIAGGESGPNARPMHPQWVRSLRDQCVDAGVPFFFKQWGEWRVDPTQPSDNVKRETPDRVAGWQGRDWFVFGDNTTLLRVGKHKAGRLLDEREWNEMPSNKAVSDA